MQNRVTKCDSKFSFFRGKYKSQNDIILTNNKISKYWKHSNELGSCAMQSMR